MPDFLLDSTTRHQIWLQRLASHEANTFKPFVKAVDKVVRQVLGSESEIMTRAQLNEITRRIRVEVLPVYTEWTDLLIDDLQKINVSEAGFVATQIDKVTDGADIATPTESVLWRLATTAPVQTGASGESAQLIPFIKSFSPRETERINGVIRNGFYKGLTASEMIQLIRGTRKNKFKDGILSTSTRNASAIARTGVSQVSNTAKQAVYAANKDVVDKWEFVATLDSNTTNICRFNDQQEFDIGEGPIPPLHVNCRSTQVPIIKKEFSILPRGEGTRASVGASGGKQVKVTPYYDWLQTQPKWFQQEALGKSRAELFRNGGLSSNEFRKITANKFGEPLTLEEIEAKAPDAWRDAGLD
jgi:SPP1 gp7 family putative phage head morphogenesis protein